MERFGPLYCETPEVYDGSFPVEPANAYSSGVIVLFGLAAFLLVYRRVPSSLVLYALCALLVINGTGSILWHGLRTRWALTLDVLPALIFVLIVVVLWARRVAPLWQSALVVVGLFALNLFLRQFDFQLGVPQRAAAMVPSIILLALWLSWRTSFISQRAAAIGGLALLSALTALTFRSMDGFACEHYGTGTHFMWHVFLSGAAYLCMLTLVTLYAPLGSGRPDETVNLVR